MRSDEAKTKGGKLHVLRMLMFLIVAVFILIYPFIFELPYPRHLMIMIFLYAMLAQAWNILAGYCGQLSLGNGVFFGIGAYTSSLLFKWYGLSPWLGMVAGAAFSVVVSQIIGFPCFKLAGHYFAIATIAINEIIRTWVNNWTPGGRGQGIALPIVDESLANFQFHSNKVPYYYIALTMLVAVYLVTFVLERSRLGYYFRAIREEPRAAQMLGIDIQRNKLIAMAICAFFTSIGGTFYAHYVLYINPSSVLGLMVSILISLIAIFGGIGTFWGPFLGAFTMVLLSEYLRIHLGGGRAMAIDLVVYGLLVVIIAVFEPGGMIVLFNKMSRTISNLEFKAIPRLSCRARGKEVDGPDNARS